MFNHNNVHRKREQNIISTTSLTCINVIGLDIYQCTRRYTVRDRYNLPPCLYNLCVIMPCPRTVQNIGFARLCKSLNIAINMEC